MPEMRVLDKNTESIRYLSVKDKRLAKLIQMIGSLSYQPHNDSTVMFAFLVHEIVEQMLSIKAGNAIFDRLLQLCGGKCTPQIITNLSVDEIKSVGTSMSKAKTIKATAEAVLNGSLTFESFPSLSDREVIERLTSIRGIGIWTAKMFLIFCLDRQDVLPFEDAAFLQSYRWLYQTDNTTEKSIVNKCRKWKPYSSIAARYLYEALDMGFTKTVFTL